MSEIAEIKICLETVNQTFRVHESILRELNDRQHSMERHLFALSVGVVAIGLGLIVIVWFHL